MSKKRVKKDTPAGVGVREGERVGERVAEGVGDGVAEGSRATKVTREMATFASEDPLSPTTKQKALDALNPPKGAEKLYSLYTAVRGDCAVREVQDEHPEGTAPETYDASTATAGHVPPKATSEAPLVPPEAATTVTVMTAESVQNQEPWVVEEGVARATVPPSKNRLPILGDVGVICQYPTLTLELVNVSG